MFTFMLLLVPIHSQLADAVPQTICVATLNHFKTLLANTNLLDQCLLK